ncbi:MAG: sigma-70 family RNA polymerase sigma factor [Candidatus Abawacabacteria bacterium]|nr:sigma-70 family RNA polymerase sigma factor [Candidatus Abawacabacteria bacterium]
MITSKHYKAFTQYYEQYFQQVYKYVFFRTGKHKDLAFDLTSELFLKALEKFDTYQEAKADFKNWIFTIARNHIIDYYRSHKEVVDIDALSNILASPETLASELSLGLDTAYALYALDYLPPTQQEVLKLKFLSDWSNKEVAHFLNKTEGNVRVLVHRALQTLKQKILSLFSPIHAQTTTRKQFEGVIKTSPSISS